MMNTLHNFWPIFLKIVKITGKNDRIGNCYDSEKTRAIWWLEVYGGMNWALGKKIYIIEKPDKIQLRPKFT